MSDPYERAKGGRLAFKGGDLATIKKKKPKKKKNKDKVDDGADVEKMDGPATSSAADGKDDIYSIDAAKKRKYDELFPVEAKKFGYVPKANFDSVAEALDDRVKKKADRYCK
ncbi:hypothetical protein IGI04_015376 [Brassica rapa subsp. trilocularis]|uniref:Uncharacterized protein n=1 Tax=Brassica rapa subsp. trilocularis TaxID=1813537 RepID=A0ABQ7MTA0_BRACM|nr:hypothetical protein IGI04_015376 [Brassica rapa subsp. trilocularis]